MAKKEKALKESEEMSIEEARKLRASMYKSSSKKKSEADKREAFRLFWAQEKAKYGRKSDIEQILWLHLKATNMDEPEKFESGIAHFGLKKVS